MPLQGAQAESGLTIDQRRNHQVCLMKHPNPANWSFQLVKCFICYFNSLPIPSLLPLTNFFYSSLLTHFCLILYTLFIAERAHDPEPHQSNLAPHPHNTLVKPLYDLLYTRAPNNILLHLLCRNCKGLIRQSM